MGEDLQRRLPGRGEGFDDAYAVLAERAIGCDVLAGDRLCFIPCCSGAGGRLERRRRLSRLRRTRS